MNNGSIGIPDTRSCGREALDELAELKNELLQVEVSLAKPRATATGARTDIKLLNAQYGLTRRVKQFGTTLRVRTNQFYDEKPAGITLRLCERGETHHAVGRRIAVRSS